MPLHVNDKRSHAYHRLPFLIHSISCSMLNKLSEAPRYDGKFPFTCPLPSLVFCIILYPLETQVYYTPLHSLEISAAFGPVHDPARNTLAESCPGTCGRSIPKTCPLSCMPASAVRLSGSIGYSICSRSL